MTTTRQYICTVCDKDEPGPGVCIAKTHIPPVGCLHVSQVGDPPPDAPLCNWLLYTGKVDVHQTSLEAFASEPEPPQPIPEPPESVIPIVQGGCGTCGHHKIRKTFHESCPRKDELMFNGGTKSATILMFDTSRDGCEYWIPKPEPQVKKKERRKKKCIVQDEDGHRSEHTPDIGSPPCHPDRPGIPENHKCPGVICRFYHFCEKTGDSRERREFQAFGCGCCGFSEEKMLCRNPEGIMCTLEKRQQYRCPIRHGDEPAADPSWEEMNARKNKGMNPRTGLKRKVKENEVSAAHFCHDCPVGKDCTAQYSYAGCREAVKAITEAATGSVS